MSSQGMLLASCCCAPQPFFCQDWQACLPKRALLNINYLEVVEEIVGGTPRRVSTTSKVISCELEAVENALGQRIYLRNLPGGTGSYFFEDLFYEVPRGTQGTGVGGVDNPLCAVPCNAPYLCRRDASQLTTQTGTLDVQVRCKNPCSGGFSSVGNAYTNIYASVTGIASGSQTFSNAGLCFNAGTDGSFQVPGFTFDVNVFDVEPRCVSEFDDYVIDGALAAVDPCNPSSNGFVCNPLTQEVISATPAMSVFLQSCPELICEEFICLAPDPSDPFGSIVVSECGCASIFPGSYSNTAGERIAFNRRQVQSNVSLVVTEP